MQRVVVSKHGGPEVLVPVAVEVPEPGPGQVRIAVEAAGVSGFDLMYRRWGRLPGCPRVPFAPGEDVVGTIDEVGPGVASRTVGERVAAATWSIGIGGGYAESVCLPEAETVPVPRALDSTVAVCLVVNYLTAHLHLHDYGGARPGERLLVHGAAGGVGSALVELGRLAGLDVYGTASGRNQAALSSLGAVPIDYRAEDFVRRIRELTGDGVDVVVDTVGGASQLWRSYRTLRQGGRLVWLGSAATRDEGLAVGFSSLAVAFLLRHRPGDRSVPPTPDVGTFALRDNRWYRRTLTELLELAASGRLRPVVSEVLPLTEASEAHPRLEEGGHTGKVVLVTPAYGEDGN